MKYCTVAKSKGRSRPIWTSVVVCARASLALCGRFNQFRSPYSWITMRRALRKRRVFDFVPSYLKYYRKRGSASYIVRQWLLWEGERERERETPVTSLISRLNREWSCIWLPRRRVDQHVDAFWACRALELRSACKDKELGAWALDWAAGSSDWWTTMGKWKLCVRWSDCRGSPSSISLACFKQEE